MNSACHAVANGEGGNTENRILNTHRKATYCHMKPLTYCLISTFLLLAGCLTHEELIARRIVEKQDFFNTLPEDQQARIRKGRLQSGDSMDAVWIVYGKPDRKFTKVSGSVTNEVWSYSDYEFDQFHHPRPVYHPVRGPGGRMFWHTDYIWSPHTSYNIYEYMRIEFENNRIKDYEKEKR
jgi:hypothetical protein